MLFDRLFLASLIIGTWAFIKLFEELLPDKALNYLPKPLALYAVIIFILSMIVYSTWLALAQRRKGYFKTKFENTDLSSQIPKINNYPSIDILVAVHNEEKVIGSTIENLLGLNYPDFKIYIINDRSNDLTQEILDNYHTKFPNKVKAFHRKNDDEGHGKAAGLNYAIRHSNSELIAVFDADARVDSNFLLKMVPYLEDKTVSAVQAQKRIINSSFNYLTKLQENEYCLDSYLQCGRDTINGNVELRGNGLIIKRDVLTKVGLWDEHTLTDDLELSTRLAVNGWHIRFCPEAIVQEQAPIDLRALLRQRLRWAEGSLRRYLSNLFKMFGPNKEPKLAKQFDSFVFLSQFVVPIWIFLDVISEIVRYLKDQETHVTSLMLMSLAVWVTTLINQVFGLRIYRKCSWRTSLKRAIETNLYFLTLWPVVVLMAYRKVLFSRTKGKWHRTEHFDEVEFEVASNKR